MAALALRGQLFLRDSAPPAPATPAHIPAAMPAAAYTATPAAPAAPVLPAATTTQNTPAAAPVLQPATVGATFYAGCEKDSRARPILRSATIIRFLWWFLAITLGGLGLFISLYPWAVFGQFTLRDNIIIPLIMLVAGVFFLLRALLVWRIEGDTLVHRGMFLTRRYSFETLREASLSTPPQMWGKKYGMRLATGRGSILLITYFSTRGVAFAKALCAAVGMPLPLPYSTLPPSQLVIKM